LLVGAIRRFQVAPPVPPARSRTSQAAGAISYISVPAPMLKVSDKSLPLQVYEPCADSDVTGLVAPATVMVASFETGVTRKVPDRAVVLAEKP